MWSMYECTPTFIIGISIGVSVVTSEDISISIDKNLEFVFFF